MSVEQLKADLEKMILARQQIWQVLEDLSGVGASGPVAQELEVVLKLLAAQKQTIQDQLKEMDTCE